MITERKFNKRAYDATDNASKLEAIAFFEPYGYTLASSLDTEYFKAFDVMLEKDGKEFKIECEQRYVFHKIRNSYPTIHIPIRKKHCNFDCYIVWNGDHTEMFMIKKSVIERYIQENKMATVHCEDENGQYEEAFIDVDKYDANYYRKIDGIWKKITLNRK
jgi:hypothetical protein